MRALNVQSLESSLHARRLRVLFADDSPVARTSIAGFLQSLDHVDLYAVCDNGRAAVEHALRDQPDVALLDLQMPVMSGLDAVQILRSCLPATAVIIMTMHDHPEVRAACLAGGADAFVAKSNLAREFEQVLDQALTAARQPSRRRLEGASAAPAPATAPTANHSLSRVGVPRLHVGPAPAGAAEAKDVSLGSALPQVASAPPSRRDP